MTIIRDPGTGQGMFVNSDGEGIVRSIIESEREHASDIGKAYSWYSGERDIAGAATMLFVRNDNGGNALHLDYAVICGDNTAATVWEIAIGDVAATAAGVAITGVNNNRGFRADLAEATAFAVETGHAQGDVIMTRKVLTDSEIIVDLTGYILQRTHFIQFDQVTDNDTGSITLLAHYA